MAGIKYLRCNKDLNQFELQHLEPLTWLPLTHLPGGQPPSLTTLELLLTPGIRLPPSTRLLPSLTVSPNSCFLPHPVTQHLVPACTWKVFSGMHIGWITPVRIYRVAEPEKSKVIFNGSMLRTEGKTMTLLADRTTNPDNIPWRFTISHHDSDTGNGCGKRTCPS